MTAGRASLAAGIVPGAVLLCAAHGWGQESEADKRATLKRIAGYAALIERGRVTTGPAGDSPAARFASVLVPRIGAAAKY